jgi:hypothetical protein
MRCFTDPLDLLPRQPRQSFVAAVHPVTSPMWPSQNQDKETTSQPDDSIFSRPSTMRQAQPTNLDRVNEAAGVGQLRTVEI